MDIYGSILQNNSGYFRIRMISCQPLVLLETPSGLRLFLLAAASSLIGTCFISPVPRCGHRRSPGQQRRRLRARSRSGTGFRRLGCRRRKSPSSAGPYPGINLPTKNSCWHQLSWCSGPTCWSVCARYSSIPELYNIFLTERSIDMKNIQEYEGILAGWLELVGRVGAVHGKLAKDIHHWYESWIKCDIYTIWITLLDRDRWNGYLLRKIMDIIGWISKNRSVLWITMNLSEYQLDDIDEYLKSYMEWIYLLNNGG